MEEANPGFVVGLRLQAATPPAYPMNSSNMLDWYEKPYPKLYSIHQVTISTQIQIFLILNLRLNVGEL